MCDCNAVNPKNHWTLDVKERGKWTGEANRGDIAHALMTQYLPILPVQSALPAYIVKREVDTFHHGQTLLLSESGIATTKLKETMARANGVCN